MSLNAAVHIAPCHVEVKYEKARSRQLSPRVDRNRQKSTGIHKSGNKSTPIDRNRHFSTPIGVGRMQCSWIIGERHGDWNIKGWGHFVVYFRLNFLHFLRFGWYHFEEQVVPLWYRS